MTPREKKTRPFLFLFDTAEGWGYNDSIMTAMVQGLVRGSLLGGTRLSQELQHARWRSSIAAGSCSRGAVRRVPTTVAVEMGTGHSEGRSPLDRGRNALFCAAATGLGFVKPGASLESQLEVASP